MQPKNSVECLSVSELVFREKNKLIIDNLSMTVDRGQKVALVGLNGAGKSTLIAILTGLIKPQDGRVAINGRSAQDLDFKRNLGVQYANTQAITNLSASEYLYLCAQTKFAENKSVDNAIENVVSLWRLENILHRPMSALSQGNLQKLIISQAFLGAPEFLVLDEPTQALDPVEQQRFIDNIKRLSDSQTCIFSSHHINETVEAADRVLMLHNGQLVADIDLFETDECWLMTKESVQELEAFFSESEQQEMRFVACYSGQRSQLYKVTTADAQSMQDLKNYCDKNTAVVRFCASPKESLLPIFSALANGDL
ncbi:ABC transporter ATP-binding protein [Aliikangiella marina]|uniref:ABC transporter ATP-binding protein n=1 Tax=Aliikangiella marina TaxID=1712262 RepID=A0A545TBR3_9GAMM|nr:ABC transporter ATP-binding protein [Aliikangiella marina]TQV74639.1 ABC transporter ATP-binding protein [Aliikangiella marina]